MKLHEIVAQSIKIALDEFERIGPDVRAAAESMLSKLPLAFTGRLPYPFPWGIIKVMAEFFDDMTNVLQGLFIRIPALIAANIAVDALVLPKKFTYRVMKLSDAAKFPIQVMMDLGIRQIASGSMPNSISFTQRWEKVVKIVSAVLSKVPTKILRSLLGGIFSRIMGLVFFVIQAAKVYGIVITIWAYAKMIETEQTQDILFTKALSDKNPRQKQNVPRLKRRVGGVNP